MSSKLAVVVPDLEPDREKEPTGWFVVQSREEWQLFLEKKLSPDRNPGEHSDDDSGCDLDPNEMEGEEWRDGEDTKNDDSSDCDNDDSNKSRESSQG